MCVFRCKGLCDMESFKLDNDIRREKDPLVYKLGYKRCSLCKYYIKDNRLRCECCSSRFALRGKKSSTRQRLQKDLPRM